MDILVRSRPVSAQWRRNLMERLDALAVIHRVAVLLSNVAYPIRFRWYRASPLDAAVTLPDGKTVGIVRQGITADRSGFAKRLWRLREGPMPGALLVLMADDVRLRHARRLLSTTDVPALFALEREAVLAGSDDRIWRPLKVSAAVDLGYVLDRTDPGGELPVEDESRLASVPDDLPVRAAASDISDPMLPLFVRPAEKRALDLISDWPWISLQELAGLMGVAPQRASQLVNPLEGFGLAARLQDAGRRLALTDRGLSLLARRDRTSIGVAKKRWSVAPGEPQGLLRVAQRHRQKDPPAAKEHRAHRRRPRIPGRVDRAGAAAGVGDRPDRPAAQGLTTLPARRPDARRQPPTPSASCARAGPIGHSSWSGSAAQCGPRPCRTASRPICATTHLTGPSTTTGSGPPSWSSSTDEIAQTHFLRVAREEMRAEGGDGPPVGLSQGGHRRPGAAGRRMAHARRVGVAKDPAAPVNLDKPAGA